MRASLIMAVVALALTACTAPTPGDDAPEVLPDPVPSPTHSRAHHDTPQADPWPGEFRVRFGQEELVIGPVTYCYGESGRHVCIDGWDAEPPSVGDVDEIFVFVPVAEFTELHVNQMVDDEDCIGSIEAQTEPLGQGWWRVTPQGPAGEYRFTLFANGPGGGDMISDVLWNTPGGDLADPTAIIAVVVDNDGPDSYGVELYLNNLAAPPESATAHITVTAAGGQSLSFEATNLRTSCAPIGAAWWEGPAEKGVEAAALGEFPFTVQVDVEIDGTPHSATAVFPDDAEADDAPFLPLEFTPPLR